MNEEIRKQVEETTSTFLERAESWTCGTDSQKDAFNQAITLLGLLNEDDKINSEYFDKEQRRRIDEERNKEANQIERDKQNLTWGRVCLEMGKVVVPMALSLVGYNVFQKRVMKFEETGRVTSTAGRELHLPNFFKK